MLPGFRILFAITIMSVSVLIFGLGAAAYLRTAHDDFASAPWQPIETPASARVDLAPPTLAMLRVEPQAALPALPVREPDPRTGAADLAVPNVAADPPTRAEPENRTESVPTNDPPVAAAALPPPAEQAGAPSPETLETAEPTPDPTSTHDAPQPAAELALQTPEPEPARDATVALASAETKAADVTAAETATSDDILAEEKDSMPPPVGVASDIIEADIIEATATPAVETAPVEVAPATANPVTPPAAAAVDITASVPPATASTTAVAAAPAATPSADTLKPDDKAIEPVAPARVAALEDAALTDATPLPPEEVKLPRPRIDPAVIEARRKRLQEQQRARARAAQARRVATARARAAAKARAAVNDPFGAPAGFGTPAGNTGTARPN